MASRLMSKNFPGETPQNGTVPKKKQHTADGHLISTSYLTGAAE